MLLVMFLFLFLLVLLILLVFLLMFLPIFTATITALPVFLLLLSFSRPRYRLLGSDALMYFSLVFPMEGSFGSMFFSGNFLLLFFFQI